MRMLAKALHTGQLYNSSYKVKPEKHPIPSMLWESVRWDIKNFELDMWEWPQEPYICQNILTILSP